MNLLKKNPAVAQKPPMGWNSWDCFAANVTEEQLMANARYVRDNMKQYGWDYTYIYCPSLWPARRKGNTAPSPSFASMNTAARSRLKTASPAARAARASSRLRMRSMPGPEVRHPHHARHPPPGGACAYARARHGCDGRKDRQPLLHLRLEQRHVGVDGSKPGAQAYYDSIFQLYASWGVDFVKVDDICNTNMYKDRPLLRFAGD